MLKNISIEEYYVPDAERSLRAKIDRAASSLADVQVKPEAQTISVKSSLQSGRIHEFHRTARDSLASGRRNSDRPTYNIVTNAPNNPKVHIDKDVIYSPKPFKQAYSTI